MSGRAASLAAAAVLLALPAPARALDDGLARTPPMGWSSWNRFACDVDEQIVRGAADALVASGMRSAGYRYVVVDDCWMAPGRDPLGRLQADPDRFPSGIPALAAYVHAHGLRFGLYQDIGDWTCQGRPGLAGHERGDIQRIIGWEVDYMKLDFCSVAGRVRSDPKPPYTRIRDLVRATGRPVVLSISTWGVGQPWRWAGRAGHLWRVTGDIEDSWSSVLRVAGRNAPRWPHAGPGGWNDPDMLEVGNGGMQAREDRAHFSLWAIMAAPLLAGNDVRSMSPATRATLLRREVIAVDQDPLGGQGRRLRGGTLEVWSKRLVHRKRSLLLLNRGGRTRTASVRLDRIGIEAPRGYRVRDLWRGRTRVVRHRLRARVASHGVRMFRIAAR